MIEFSGLIAEVMDEDNRGQTMLIVWYFFVLFICLIDLCGWGNFSQQMISKWALIPLLVFLMVKMQGLGVIKFEIEFFMAI